MAEPKQETAEEEYVTSAVVGRYLGYSAKTVQQFTGNGIIETIETPRGRRYDLPATCRQYVKYLSDKAYGREKREAIEKLEEEKLTAEVEIKKSKAEAAKLELAELRGKMHRAEDVEAIMTDHVLFLRSMLMAMPGKLAVDLSNLHTASEMAERVKQEVYYILNNLADYRYDADAYKKRVMERQGWNNQHGDDVDD